MDLFKPYEFTVDTMRKKSNTESEREMKTIRFSQGDYNSGKLLPVIRHDGKEVDLSTSASVRMAFLKPDGHRVLQDCFPVNKMLGKYYVVLDTQTIAVYGKVIANLIITFENGNKLETQKFSFTVDESIMNADAVESMNELQPLDQLLETADALKKVDVPVLIDSATEVQNMKDEVAQQKDQIGILSQNEKTAKTTFQNNEQYIQRGRVTPKLIQNNAGTYFITTKKPTKKGYVRFRLREGVVTTTESQGGQGEFLRIVEVIEVAECFLMTNLPSAKSSTDIFGVSNINYVINGIGQQSIPCTSITTKTAGAWVEYQVTTPKGVREIEVLIYKSSGSSDNVNISVDGVNILTGISFMSTTSGFHKIRIPLPTSGSHTVRFTTVTSAYMTIAGVNVVNLTEFSSEYNFDYCVNIANTNGNQYVTSNGAMDYALLDSDTNLWCGSYHGGETRNRILFIFDGIGASLTDGQFKVFNTLEIEQDTNIANKVNAYSRQIFSADGERELQVVFKGDINLKTMFVNMSTTLDTFSEVVYPVQESLATVERVYLPEGTNYIIQKNPTNNQKCITILNQNKLGSTETPFIKKLAGSYCKVYNSNIQSESSFNFKGGAFRVSHIFD